jgi:hypothetical protein
MKLTIQSGGAMLHLRAETPFELEFLEKMQGSHEPGPWHDAEFRLVGYEELGFDHLRAGKHYHVGDKPKRVMAEVKLNPEWLVYSKPKTIEERLRANAAARIGHSLLDGFELIRGNS